jgi:hypothetical protein
MKITNVQQSGTWTGQYGVMYRMEVTLDDGRTGEVSAKKPDAWKVGDECEIEKEEQTQYGTRWKIRKPGFTNGPSGAFSGPKNEETTKRIDASWALGQAVALWACNPAASKQVADLENLKQLAKAILATRDELINDGK